MFGNGVPTGMPPTITPTVLRIILKTPQNAPTGCAGAAAGITSRLTAAWRYVTPSRPTTGTTFLVSVSSGWSRFLGSYFFVNFNKIKERKKWSIYWDIYSAMNNLNYAS